MADRRTPFTVAGERETLRAFLDYLRDAMVVKITGLDDDAVRRPLVPSGTSLLGLVKHLTRVETAWFPFAFAGEDVVVPKDELEAGDTVESVVEAYRGAVRRANDILDGAHDLDQCCVHRFVAPERMSLRWIMVHMIEETGRHAGHADILREQLDGETGR